MTPRRQFLMLLPATVLIARTAQAQALDEKDPTAVSLGYVADASKVDKARFKQYAAGQQCGNCQLFQGAAGATSGACPIYGGKTVAAAGWCSAYAKKA